MEQSVLPLTLSQQILHDALARNPELRSTVSLSARLVGELDIAAFRASLRDLVERHDALRIAIGTRRDGTAYQWFREAPAECGTVKIQRIKASSEDQFTRFVRKVAMLDTLRAWDMSEDYPFRFRLLSRTADCHAFLATFAHQTVDSATHTILTRDLWQLYRRRVDGESAAPAQSHGSFAEAVRAQLDRDLRADDNLPIDFWRGRLEQAHACAFTFTAPQDPVATAEPIHLKLSLTGPRLTALRIAARRSKCSELQLIQGAFAATIFEFTQQRTITFTTPVDTRRRADHGVLGMFDLSLPLTLERAASWPELLAAVRQESFDVLRHRQVTHRMLTGIGPSSAGWIGGGSAGNLRMSYVRVASAESQPADDAIQADYGWYKPRLNRVSAAVELRIGSWPDRIEFGISFDGGQVPESSARAVTHTLDRLLTFSQA